ncbi:unnamed protein product [Clonostachys rosea f. rosea IK726]|uniref:Protein kinase domain-containing protein n=2 Tax=Bionectria ochroleuca TaxID=29856 RepID=A0A0B7KH67_BIOOC|nr:unnamed protein product [Clonostachys rosea f. rosea IK726]
MSYRTIEPYLGSSYRLPTKVVVPGAETGPPSFNFLSFLATVQRFRLQILPILWDAGRQDVGAGATSRVSEGTINVDTSFAYKRVNREKTEAQIFQAFSNEISVLSHPMIRRHRNVAQLQGICWEISPADNNPWPVLVFEKTHLGDLRTFMRLSAGSQLGVKGRLGLCLGIGNALRDFHNHGIIHGDIKPENIVIFRVGQDEYDAKLIDFGYSTLYSTQKLRVQLPISKPWNAPEHDRAAREWTFEGAKLADVYSFGLLCLWVLFERSLSGLAPLPPSVSDPQIRRLLKDGDWYPNRDQDTILEMKAYRDSLQSFAGQLVDAQDGLTGVERSTLEMFLRKSLSKDSLLRVGSLELLLEGFGLFNPSTETTTQNISMVTSPDIDFKITTSIEDLYRCDYRLRSKIFQCLNQTCHRNSPLAFQLAICHYIGFGTLINIESAESILKHNNMTIETAHKAVLNYETDDEKSDEIPQRLSEVIEMGHFDSNPLIDLYQRENRLPEASSSLENEIVGVKRVLGDMDGIVRFLMSSLSSILALQGRWAEAEAIELELVKISKATLGDSHRDTLNAMADLASTYRDQNRWQEAVELEEQILNTSRNALGEGYIDTMSSMGNLATTYSYHGRFKEAERLYCELYETNQRILGAEHYDTLSTGLDLAALFRQQGRFKESEVLFLEVLEKIRRVLGDDHPDALRGTSGLATSYVSQRQWSAASILLGPLVEKSKAVLGPHNVITLRYASKLASVLASQDRLEEAETMSREIFETRRSLLGEDHLDTLRSMNRLARICIKQKKPKDAEDLLEPLSKMCPRVLGDTHELTIDTIASLAVVYAKQGQMIIPIRMLEEMAEKLKSVLYDDYSDLVYVLSELAVIQLKFMNLGEAEKLCRQILELCSRAPNDKHPGKQSALETLGRVYLRQQRFIEEQKILAHILELKRESLGEEHPDTLASMHELACRWVNCGYTSKSQALMRTCISLRRRVLGVGHPLTKESEQLLKEWQAG